MAYPFIDLLPKPAPNQRLDGPTKVMSIEVSSTSPTVMLTLVAFIEIAAPANSSSTDTTPPRDQPALKPVKFGPAHEAVVLVPASATPEKSWLEQVRFCPLVGVKSPV